MAPVTAPTRESPQSPVAGSPRSCDQPRETLVQRRVARVLELGRPRVRGADQHEEPGAGGRAAAISGSSASRPSSGLAVKASAPSPGTAPNGPGVSPTSAWA